MNRPARNEAGLTAKSDDSVPLRVGGRCPHCGADVEDLDFLSLPSPAIEREMYDVCVLDTDDLPTPWRHRTAIVYHEDPLPFDGSPGVTLGLHD